MSAPEQFLKRINKIPRGRFFASNNVVKHIIFAAIDSMPYNDCAVLLQRHWRRATGLNGFHIAHIRRQRVSTGCKSIYITILTQAKNKFAITGITFQPNIFIGHCKKFAGTGLLVCPKVPSCVKYATLPEVPAACCTPVTITLSFTSIISSFNVHLVRPKPGRICLIF